MMQTFACYEVSDLEEPLSKSFKRLLQHIEVKRVLVGAERVNAHITLGSKTGREAMATIKPYQENRDPDKPIKVRVRELRQMLSEYKSNTVTPVFKLMYEADDVMIQYQEARIKEFGVKASIIMSGDKDLWMGQGYHADPKTGRIYLVDGFGKTTYREVGNVKPKLVGEGTSWFWHQLVMGDKVDNIPGLERIANKTLDMYLPLKSRKPRKAGSAACGEAKAVAMLLNTNERLAAKRVYSAYVDYYGESAMERFLEQAYLLWMQRTDDPYDVIYYMKSVGINITPTNRQRKVLDDFKEICK